MESRIIVKSFNDQHAFMDYIKLHHLYFYPCKYLTESQLKAYAKRMMGLYPDDNDTIYYILQINGSTWMMHVGDKLTYDTVTK